MPAATEQVQYPDGTREAKAPMPAQEPDERLKREYGFTFRIVLFARRYRAMLDEKLRPLGYGSARMEALAAIAHCEEASSQISIAKKIGIEGPTLTRMLDSLEAEGLVTRRPDANDRRTKLLELTPEGHQALAEILQIARQFRASFLASISDDELDQVNRTIGKLLCTLHGDPMH